MHNNNYNKILSSNTSIKNISTIWQRNNAGKTSRCEYPAATRKRKIKIGIVKSM